MPFSPSIIRLLLFGFFLTLFACKSDQAFEEEPTPQATGIFYARGTLMALQAGADTLTYDYRSGELDPWGAFVVATTYPDYVNFAPYKSLIGRLTRPAIPIFSVGIQSLNEVEATSLDWNWSAQEVSDILRPGDTLSIGYGPGQAILGLAHPAFQLQPDPFYTLPEENQKGFSALGEGRVIIRETEPFSVTANTQTRAGLRVHMDYQARLNGVFGQPDYWTQGEAVMFYEY